MENKESKKIKILEKTYFKEKMLIVIGMFFLSLIFCFKVYNYEVLTNYVFKIFINIILSLIMAIDMVFVSLSFLKLFNTKEERLSSTIVYFSSIVGTFLFTIIVESYFMGNVFGIGVYQGISDLNKYLLAFVIFYVFTFLRINIDEKIENNDKLVNNNKKTLINSDSSNNNYESTDNSNTEKIKNDNKINKNTYRILKIILTIVTIFISFSVVIVDGFPNINFSDYILYTILFFNLNIAGVFVNADAYFVFFALILLIIYSFKPIKIETITLKKHLIFIAISFLICFVIFSHNSLNKWYEKTELQLEKEDKKKREIAIEKKENDGKEKAIAFYTDKIASFDIKDLDIADVGDIVVFGHETLTNNDFKEKYDKSFEDTYCIVMEKNDNILKLMTYFAPIKKLNNKDFYKSFYADGKRFYDSEILKEINDELFNNLSDKEKQKIALPYNELIENENDLRFTLPSDEEIFEMSLHNPDITTCYPSFISNANIETDDPYDKWYYFYNDEDFLLLPHNVTDLVEKCLRIYNTDKQKSEKVNEEYASGSGQYVGIRPVFYVDIDG